MRSDDITPGDVTARNRTEREPVAMPTKESLEASGFAPSLGSWEITPNKPPKAPRALNRRTYSWPVWLGSLVRLVAIVAIPGLTR